MQMDRLWKIYHQPKFDAYLSVGSVYDKNEKYHNHNYNTTLISYYNQIHNLNFNPSTPMFTCSMPFDYNMTRIKQQPIFVHEDMRLPKSWKGFGDLTQFNARVNGQRLSVGRSLAIDPFSFPNDTIVHYLLKKNDIIRIAEAFNANHTKNAVTSRSVNTTGLMNFVLEPSGKPSAQIRNTTNNTSSLIIQQTARPIPASNNTYTNSSDGISFSIPENWTTEEGQNHANATRLTIVTVSPPIALDPSALMQVIVQKDTKPLTSSIDQYLRDQLNSHRSNPSNNFKLISANTNVTISGHPAFLLLWTFTPQASYAGQSGQLEVGTLLNGQGYLIDYSGSISLFSEFLPQVQQIIKTLVVQPLAAAADAVLDKGLALENLRNYTGAIVYFDKALAIDPNDTYALDNKGISLYNLRNYTGAIVYFDKALAIDPKYKSALTDKTMALEVLGKYENVLLNKGANLADSGNYTGAIKYYDKVLAIDPHYADALNNKRLALDNLGNYTLIESRNYTGAIKYYDKALAIDPNDESALLMKGYGLDNLRNYTGAIKYYDRALTIQPDNNSAAYRGMGHALVKSGNYTGAIKYSDKALALDPNDTFVLDNKAAALVKSGNYTGAIKYSDKALALDPNDTFVLDNKAAALDNSGNYTGAKLYYDKALTIKSTIAAPVYPGQAQNVNSTNKEASNQTSVTAGNSTINLKLDNKAYPIKYQLIGGKLTAISAEKNNITLLLNVSSTSNGRLTIELPRYVIDSKKQGNVDDNYAVFVDGQYAAADEIRTTAQARTLMVDFDNGTSVIEITGTHMVPVQSSNTNMTSSNMTTSTVVNNATNSFVNPGTNIGNSTFPNTTTTNSTAGSSNSNAQNHPIIGSTYSIPAAESVSIPFSIPGGVTSAYLSGTVLITGGILSTVDFSIVNSDTGTVLMRQVYTDQGNIGIHIPAGSYTIILHNGSLLAGETHTVTLTLNAFY
jgi:tetratricopeptide (TPR) repeat protein